MILHVVRLVEHGKYPFVRVYSTPKLSSHAIVMAGSSWGSHILYGLWPCLTYHATHEFNFVNPFRKQ